MSGGFADHLTPPFLDDVKVITLIALFDHDFACHVACRFHAQEHGLNIGRRDAIEGLGLQDAGHPIVGIFPFIDEEFVDFVGNGLVPGEHDVEQIAVDPHILHLGLCPGGISPRLLRGQRVTRLRGAARDGAYPRELVSNSTVPCRT